jgi:CHAT domain
VTEVGEFLTLVGHIDTLVGYVAAHGGGAGSDQALTIGGRLGLTSATALSNQWPATVVFASCFVGRVQHALGNEPLGVAVSCMMRGATSVIGGAIEIDSLATSIIGPATVAAIRTGMSAAKALRAAQLDYFLDHPNASVHEVFGSLCLSLVIPQ